eukprot:UC4_evm4s420
MKEQNLRKKDDGIVCDSNDDPSIARPPIIKLGCVGACAFSTLMLTAQATPFAAEALFKGKSPSRKAEHTLRVLNRIGILGSLAQISIVPLSGSFGDHFGRRFLLMVSCTLLALCHGIVAFLPAPPGSSTLPIVLSQACQTTLGIGGVIDACVQASISDFLSGASLAAATAKARTVQAVGLVIGPLLAGNLMRYGHRAPFAIASAISIGGCIIASTLPCKSKKAVNKIHKHRTDFDYSVLNPFVLFKKSSKLARLTCICAISMAAEYTQDIRILFMRDKLNYNPRQIGKFSSLAGTVAICSSFSTGYIIRCIGPWWCSILGTSAAILFNITTSYGTISALYLSLLFQYFGGITMRLSSLFAAHSEQGVRDGLGAGQVASLRLMIFALQNLVLRPLVFNRLYSKGKEGRPYLAAAACSFISLLGITYSDIGICKRNEIQKINK